LQIALSLRLIPADEALARGEFPGAGAELIRATRWEPAKIS